MKKNPTIHNIFNEKENTFENLIEKIIFSYLNE